MSFGYSCWSPTAAGTSDNKTIKRTTNWLVTCKNLGPPFLGLKGFIILQSKLHPLLYNSFNGSDIFYIFFFSKTLFFRLSSSWLEEVFTYVMQTETVIILFLCMSKNVLSSYTIYLYIYSYIHNLQEIKHSNISTKQWTSMGRINYCNKCLLDEEILLIHK